MKKRPKAKLANKSGGRAPPRGVSFQSQVAALMAVHAVTQRGMSAEVYAIHRSWWPGLAGEDADVLLVAHLRTLNGDKAPPRLERIIRSLQAELAKGQIREPGKLVERRIEQANTRGHTGSTHRDGADTVPFKGWETLGQFGFGGKVSGADATDILAAVPGSDLEEIRRQIRKVCGEWAGQNGRNKSTQHVVDEVMRRLRASSGASQAEQPGETILVEKPTNNAKDDAAELAALRKRMTSHPPPGRQQSVAARPVRSSRKACTRVTRRKAQP